MKKIEIEEKIRKFMSLSGKTSVPNIIGAVKDRSVTEQDVRRAVWRMLNRNELLLDWDRKVYLGEQNGR